MSVAEADIEAFLAGLVRQEGRDLPTVQWVDRGGSRASVRPGRGLIVLDRRILAHTDDAHFTAAHELGHLILGHTAARRSGSLMGLYVGTLMAAMALVTWAMIVLGGTTWITLAPVLGMLAWIPLQTAMSRKLKQPQEYAADLYAAGAGAPLTKTLAERYEAERSRAGRFWSHIFPLHPSWADRASVTAAARHTPPEGQQQHG